MCGFNKSNNQNTATPAPAPAPAEPAPLETEIGEARRDENESTFGRADGPNLRVDRSVNPPGAGTGLKI